MNSFNLSLKTFCKYFISFLLSPTLLSYHFFSLLHYFHTISSLSYITFIPFLLSPTLLSYHFFSLLHYFHTISSLSCITFIPFLLFLHYFHTISSFSCITFIPFLLSPALLSYHFFSLLHCFHILLLNHATGVIDITYIAENVSGSGLGFEINPASDGMDFISEQQTVRLEDGQQSAVISIQLIDVCVHGSCNIHSCECFVHLISL